MFLRLFLISLALVIPANAEAEGKKLIGSYCDKSLGPAIGYFLYDFYQDEAGDYHLAEQSSKELKADPPIFRKLDVIDQNILGFDNFFQTRFEFNDGNVLTYEGRDATPRKTALSSVNRGTRYKDCLGWG